MTVPPGRVEPVTRSSGQARAFYDRLSRYYDWLSGSGERRFVEIGLKMLAANPGERLLEVGFGTGHALAALAPQVAPTGHIYGLDLSPGMAAVARLRLLRQGLGNCVSLVCGNGLNLPFPAAALDGILMSFTLELFDTPAIPLVLAECHRVLQPGGRLVVVALSQPAQPSRSVAVYEWFHRRFPQAVDCRPIPVVYFIEHSGFSLRQAHSGSLLGLLPVVVARAVNAKSR